LSVEEVVEAPRADDVHHHAFHKPALADRHLGLRDRAIAGDVARPSAQEVQKDDPFLEALPAHRDECLGRALEPGRGHPAVLVPDGPKALPVAGIAPECPVLNRLADREPVGRQIICHGAALSILFVVGATVAWRVRRKMPLPHWILSQAVARGRSRR
jgi:hypothetical protein